VDAAAGLSRVTNQDEEEEVELVKGIGLFAWTGLAGQETKLRSTAAGHIAQSRGHFNFIFSPRHVTNSIVPDGTCREPHI
jgi:hypothetical protein